MLTDNLVTIGKLTRTHGVEGKAILVFESWAFNQLKKTEWVFLNINGLPVPFFITSIEINSPTTAIIELEDITTVEQMRIHINRQVLIPWQGKHKPATLQSVVGYHVINENQSNIGQIAEVSDFNGNIVARVKHNHEEIWIPLNETTLQQINHRKKIIFVVLPDGLLDIYKK